MDASILEEIGLTHVEIKVFLALIDLGTASAGAIVQKTGLQNTSVHRSLHSLTGKGLLTYTLVGKQKKYQSVDPNLLLTHLDEKRAKLKSIIPELVERTKLSNSKPQVVIYQGAKGIKELLHHMLETDAKEYYAYGGNQSNVDLLGDFFWKNFHTKRSEMKISAQLLFNDSLKHWIPILNVYPLTEVKTTQQIFDQVTETVICGGRVAVLVFVANPFGVLIEEGEAANSYMKFFELLWESADSNKKKKKT
jgi:sugar-specific transcriptional regulator TrmB